MSLARLPYRAWQFWLALSARPDASDQQAAAKLLGPALGGVFMRMQQGEQAHSLNVLRQLQRQGESDNALLTAALLHDAGKSLRPLRVWERVWIVVYAAVFPGQLTRWAGLTPAQVGGLAFWQQPLAVAACHPAWGAQLAAEGGAPDLALNLITAHQDRNRFTPTSPEARLLAALQAVDDLN